MVTKEFLRDNGLFQHNLKSNMYNTRAFKNCFTVSFKYCFQNINYNPIHYMLESDKIPVPNYNRGQFYVRFFKGSLHPPHVVIIFMAVCGDLQTRNHLIILP